MGRFSDKAIEQRNESTERDLDKDPIIGTVLHTCPKCGAQYYHINFASPHRCPVDARHWGEFYAKARLKHHLDILRKAAQIRRMIECYGGMKQDAAEEVFASMAAYCQDYPVEADQEDFYLVELLRWLATRVADGLPIIPTDAELLTEDTPAGDAA